jgi:ribonuclease P protein component
MASGLAWRALAGARCCGAGAPRAASASRSRFRESSPVEPVRRETFPKSARLRKRKEFLSIQREGRRHHTAHFVVIRRPAAGGISRLGITVSSRVGNSPVRNRIKRLMREVFRRHREALSPPSDVVIIARPGADNLTYAHAATEFARALELQPAR